MTKGIWFTMLIVGIAIAMLAVAVRDTTLAGPTYMVAGAMFGLVGYTLDEVWFKS